MEQKVEMTLIEAVRKRPAMYVGSTSVRGFNNLLNFLVNDVFKATRANYFSFELLGQLKGKLIFNNLQKNISDDVVQTFWRKRELYQAYELAALNALSKYFEFKVFDKDNACLFQQVFENGQLKQGEILNQNYEANRFEITFDLDDSILILPNP